MEFGLMMAVLIGLNDDWYKKTGTVLKRVLTPFNSPDPL